MYCYFGSFSFGRMAGAGSDKRMTPDLKPGDDKPTKYKTCKVHGQFYNGLFCFDHKELICVKCHKVAHDKCSVTLVSEAATCVKKTDMDKYMDAVLQLRMGITFYSSLTEDNILKVQTQRNHMLKEAQAIHGRLIVKINRLYYELKEEIFEVCKEQSVFLSNQKARIDTVLSNIDQCLHDMEQLKGTDISSESMFISLQEAVSQTRRYAPFLKGLQESSKIIELSLKPSQDILEILESPFSFGSARINFRECHALKPIQSISFPILAHAPSTQSNTAVTPKFVENSLVTSSLQGIKQPAQETESEFSLRMSAYVQTKCDSSSCLINNIAVTETGKRLLTDFSNHKVKLFSSNMKLKSTLALSDAPRGLAYVGKNEIVCTTDKQLHFIDLCDEILTTRYMRKFKHSVYDVRACDGNLYLSRATSPPSIKRIDKTGKTDWTVCKNKQGQKLFSSICHLTCSVLNGDIRVVATDYEAETVTTLDGKTGRVLTVRKLKGKGPRGVTTDSDGNIYVCYAKTNEICMMSRDMSSDKILLSLQEGLSPDPLAIAYDRNSDQMIVSSSVYFHRETVAVFQRSFYV